METTVKQKEYLSAACGCEEFVKEVAFRACIFFKVNFLSLQKLQLQCVVDVKKIVSHLAFERYGTRSYMHVARELKIDRTTVMHHVRTATDTREVREKIELFKNHLNTL